MLLLYGDHNIEKTIKKNLLQGNILLSPIENIREESFLLKDFDEFV